MRLAGGRCLKINIKLFKIKRRTFKNMVTRLLYEALTGYRGSYFFNIQFITIQDKSRQIVIVSTVDGVIMLLSGDRISCWTLSQHIISIISIIGLVNICMRFTASLPLNVLCCTKTKMFVSLINQFGFNLNKLNWSYLFKKCLRY